MPTRARKTTSKTAQGASKPSAPPAFSAPSLARGSAGPSLGSVPLRLEPGRGPWTWCISAARLGCRNGRIVPLAVKAFHAPGISANIRGDNGSGYVQQLIRMGYVPIPHDRLPCVAFGEDRSTAPDSTYLHRWQGVSLHGYEVDHWRDAWHRPQRLGNQVIWQEDAEGRDLFLSEALRDLCNGGDELSDVQITLATRPILQRIRSEATMDGPGARKLVRQMATHLPREHHTDDVRDILARMEITLPAV